MIDTDVKAPPTEAPPDAPRTRILRNREVDKVASAMANDHILPIPPGKTLDWEQVEKYLALLTPAMWSHFTIYVYRLKPKIRRQLKDPNSPNYIDCISEPFTLEYFISRHGGGKYQLQAVDADAKRDPNNTAFFKCLLDINDVQYPPIIDFAELELEARENKSYIAWLQNKGILGSDGKPLPPPTVAPPPSATANLSAKEVLDILGYAHKMSADQQAAFRQQFAPADSLGKSVGDILLEKMKQDDPRHDWDRMIAFMERVNKPDGTFAQMLQMQQEQRKTDLEYTRLLLTSQQQQGNTPRSQFTEFREMLTFARELLGTGGGHGRRNGWDTGLEIARDVALPAIQSIGSTIANIMALRSGAAPVPGAPGAAAPRTPPQAFDPYSNPAAARTYAQTLSQTPPPQPPPAPAPAPPAPAPAAAPAPQPVPPAPGLADDAHSQLFALFAQYGNLIIGHLNSGTPGYDFAGMIVDLMGTATHAMIANYGEEALAATMMRIPEFTIFGEARLRQFVNEFVHYQKFFEDEPAEEPEPEVPVLEPEIIDTPKFYRPPARPAKGTHA